MKESNRMYPAVPLVNMGGVSAVIMPVDVHEMQLVVLTTERAPFNAVHTVATTAHSCIGMVPFIKGAQVVLVVEDLVDGEVRCTDAVVQWFDGEDSSYVKRLDFCFESGKCYPSVYDAPRRPEGDFAFADKPLLCGADTTLAHALATIAEFVDNVMKGIIEMPELY